MYILTQSQWDVIDAICKMELSDGQRFFRERDERTGRIVNVAVQIDARRAQTPVDVPAHYAHCWPLDPRD